MSIKIENLAAKKMAFFRNVGPYGSEENFKMMKEFKKWIRANGLSKNWFEYGVYGIAQDNPEVTSPNECRYDVIIPVDNDDEVKEPAMSGNFAGGRYAVFTITHTTEAVKEFWHNLNMEITENNLILRKAPIIERYKEEEGEDKYCEFLVPIQ
ncbi:SPBc2 prophage-derived putative transcriptional regulator YosT [Bacillus sp. J14TS2]|uniref:AraC family transcriptional regulator n=1 Tax=Bacillus sp. J14TS2 TaxID=2807188 RepID=UPI001B2832D7|nr:GyrI-like domain-containing protein [Bacillus sp. J14TS2]GIN74235.1 SPBc2 prophage-derived putative transcriptional regulator YosT [Bacillus sp. J14TS2]